MIAVHQTPPLLFLVVNFCFLFGVTVICPGDAGHEVPGNRTLMLLLSTEESEFEAFEMWWSKSRTVPLYLIAVLLPLLNFKSPSFFAKFNILGRQERS